MKKIPLQQIQQTLSRNNNVAFAYIFGSCSGRAEIKDGSDLDIAIYFYQKPDLDSLYKIICDLEEVTGEGILDLIILNDCENFILRNEILKGDMIFCREPDLHAGFFSWTLRMYEDQVQALRRMANE